MDFLSPDSRCYSFDERANGYSRGEGFGIIIIKRLRDAIKDGDTIRAVIRGVGSNQDGKTAGISQPNSEAQESLIRSTYRKAGLDWAQTKLFEAHGTGTQVGDSLEARAIANVFREWNTEASPLYVGAVKTNVGHLEGGSGMASIIKTVLALENGIIPPNAGLRHANPNIPFREWNLKVRTSSPFFSTSLMNALTSSRKSVRHGQSTDYGGLVSTLLATVAQTLMSYLMMHTTTYNLIIFQESTVPR